MNNNVLITIGLSEFDDNSVPVLNYAVFDSRRTERLFIASGITKHVVRLENSAATKNSILSTIQGITSNTDVLYLYISTHGKTIRSQKILFTYVYYFFF